MSAQPPIHSPWVRVAAGAGLAGVAMLMLWDPQPTTYIGGGLLAAVLVALGGIARIIDREANDW